MDRNPPAVRSMSESYDIPLNWPADYRARHGKGGEMPSELVADVLKEAMAWDRIKSLGRDVAQAEKRLHAALHAYQRWANLKEVTK